MSFTKEQLCSALKRDGIYPYVNKRGFISVEGVDAMNDIGYEYKCKQKYDKAMAWYRLAAAENNAMAQNNIGFLHFYGYGVPQNGLLGIEWYLKAAIQNFKPAWKNIGFSFECGNGVPVDRYKAYEWYKKCIENPKELIASIVEGTELTCSYQLKTMKQLIIETEEIILAERKKKDDKINELDQLKTKLEAESKAKDKTIESLEEKIQKFSNKSNLKEEGIYEVEMLMKGDQLLNYTSDTQDNQLEEQDDAIIDLKNKITSLIIEFNKVSEKVKQLGISNESVEKSTQNLEELFEQEKQRKDDEFASIKQEISSLNKKTEEERYVEI